MCNPMSWIDKDGVILFLIGADLETERGRKLIKYTQNRDDLCGHGAIRYFYGTESESGEITPMIGGIDKEVIDFDIYLFKKLPLKIKMAIGTGEMRGIWCGIKGLLRAPLYADYEAACAPLDADYKAKRDTLYADYKAACAPLYADYEAACAPLDADYEAKRDTLYADYEAKRAPLYADYKAKRNTLYADYKAACAPLYADYKAKRDTLDADYEAKRDTLFWDLFAIKSNRLKRWR